MRYPGGKGRCYPQILNLIPPHTTYVETHLGGGAVLRRKSPSARHVGIDLDPAVISAWRDAGWQSYCELVLGDASEWLEHNKLEPTAFIYADPPYLASTRRRQRVYRFDYTENDHVKLLRTLKKLTCNVVVSGYKNSLYEELLGDWNTRTFLAASHVGLREEAIWFNFDPPKRLHDARYLGSGYREREAIRRRRSRLEQRVSRMSLHEQHSLYEWLGAKLQRIDQ